MTPDTTAFLRETLQSFEAALKAAYERGLADGREDALQRVVAAVRGPAPEQEQFVHEPVIRHRERSSPSTEGVEGVDALGRAPRGLVPTVLERALREHPGGTIKDYEGVVTAMDPRVSAKSVGNELRRGERSRYRRDGYRWYLIEENEAADITLAGESAASSTGNQGGTDERSTLALEPDLIG